MSTHVASEIGRSHLGEDAPQRISDDNLPMPAHGLRIKRPVARSRGLVGRSVRVAMAALASLLVTSVSASVASASTLNFTQQDFQPQSLTDQAPALGSYGGYTYLAWKGKDTDKVFYSSDNGRCGPPGDIQLGSCWSRQVTVSGTPSLLPGTAPSWGPARTLDAPALVTYDGDLYAFWTGETEHNIFYSAYNGTSWSKQEKVGAEPLVVYASQGPSAAVYDGDLYVAWNDGTDFFFAKFNGKSWTSEPFISSLLGSAPALVAYSGDLYAFWVGVSGNAVSSMAYDGDTWSTPEPVSGAWGSALTNEAPTATVCDGQLYLAWKGETTNRILYSSLDGSSWAPQQVVPQALTNDGPALGASGDDLYVAWKGETHDKAGFVDADLAPPPPTPK